MLSLPLPRGFGRPRAETRAVSSGIGRLHSRLERDSHAPWHELPGMCHIAWLEMAAQQTIVIDHLARLEDRSVVVAGIDGRHEHIAPRRAGPWDTAATARGGGPFDIGMAVDIGFSRRSGTPPLVEEREVDESGITALGRLPDGQF